MKKILKYIIITLLSLFLLGTLTGLGIIAYFKRDIPNIENLVENYTPSVPTRVYDINGELIDTLYRETRILAPFSEIPDSVKNAFLSVEDRRFYSHYGIDPIGLTRAILVNLKSGRAVQGASSFTQQLSRNAFLNHDRKLTRKIKELIIAFEIEKRYTKDEIFEKYLNEIYFGQGDYGIKSAASSLFRKGLGELNYAEAAMLAGIPNRPGYYNPRESIENAKRRMNIILKLMLNFDMITEKDYNKAIKHEFYLEKDAPKIYDPEFATIVYPKTSANKSLAPSFTDLVLDYLLTHFDEKTIYEGGLEVYTTLNYDMQVIAEKTFNHYKPIVEDENLQGGMVTLDSTNGHIVSIVGGRNFVPGNFNRALMAKRQIGSSFKPFIYLSAIENGYEPNTLIEDSRVLYDETWAPRNYGVLYRKSSTLLEGIRNSVNIVAIKLLKEIGHKNLRTTLAKLETDLKPAADLSAALGSLTSTPLNLAKAYSIFSNGGYVVDPIYVLEVRDINKATLIKNAPKVKKAFDTKEVALTADLLFHSVATGSSKNSKVKTSRGDYIAQGGKTGTTNDARSVWYAGFTPEYVTTVYLGYDDNSVMPEGSSGGTTAAPLWRDYYTNLINQGVYSPSKFEYIDNLVATGILTYQDLDLYTGLISTARNKTTFLIETDKMQLEKREKYQKNLTDILYY